MPLLFGTSGVPTSSRSDATEDGIARVAELRLGCMELEFVRGVRMSEEHAARVRPLAEKKKVALSAHAPYFVNLNAKGPEKVEAGRQRVLASARRGAQAGARNIVFHPGYYLDDPPAAVYDRIRDGVAGIRAALDAEGLEEIILRPETAGKPAQFGSLEELLRLSNDVRGVTPCVDFSHLHARAGAAVNDYEAFSRILEQVGGALGDPALRDMHIHLSGIEYGGKGERRHVSVENSDMNWEAALRALRAFGAGGRVVCEGPAPEVDALKFQKTYRALSRKKGGAGL